MAIQHRLELHYPRPPGSQTCEDRVLVQSSLAFILFPQWPPTSALFLAMLLLHLTHLTPLDQHLPVEQLLLLPYLPQILTLLPHQHWCAREGTPFQLILSFSILSLLFLHHSFHLVGILYRQCQSPVVTEREPGQRPLSLIHPTVLGAQRGRSSPVHRTVLLRTNSLPSDGLRFPALPPGDEGLIEGCQEDDLRPRKYLF